MERATKERLTGAVILVAALAILVPEMLSGPGRNAVPDDAGAVADTGPPLTTYDLAIDPAGAQGVARQRELAGVASEAEAITQAVPPPVTGPVRPATPEVAAPAAIVPPAAPAGDIEPVTARTSPQAGTAAGSRQQAAPALPAPATRSAAAATGGWWVQLGSFSSAQNAQGLARKLRARGFAIEVTTVHSGGRDLHRVRAGPEKDRAAATALLGRLADAGEKGTLVAP